MFAPSPGSLTATGSYTIADHFPGNQERGGAALAKKLLQEAGQQTKGAILSPCIPLPFLPRYKEKGFAKARLWTNSGQIEEVISLL